MRILHVTRDYPPRSKGGLSTAVAGLVSVALNAGFEVAVISFDDWRPKQHGGAESLAPEPVVRDERLRVLRVSGPDHIESGHRFAADFGPDLVHLHSGMLLPFTEGLPCAAFLLFHVHVAQDLVHQWRRLTEPNASLLGYERALESADSIVFPSREVFSKVTATRPHLQGRSRVLPFGIWDTPEARDAVVARRTEDNPGGVLYVGRFADVKGTRELVEIYGALRERYPTLPLQIVGGSPASGKQTRRWLRRFEEVTGQAGVLCQGWLGPDEIVRAYRRARVLLIPSHLETFGLVALEGMLHGLPIVASDCMGLRERLEHEVSAHLVSPGDVGAFVGAVSGLLDGRERAFKLGQEAAVRVRESWLWETVGPAWVQAYIEMPSEHTSPVG